MLFIDIYLLMSLIFRCIVTIQRYLTEFVINTQHQRIFLHKTGIRISFKDLLMNNSL